MSAWGIGANIVSAYNWDRGLQRVTSGTGLIGTTALTTAITIGRAGILTTIPGDLRVEGVTTLVGGENFDGNVTLTGQLRLADGTLAAPGVAFASETNTGLRRVGANVVRLVVAGADIMEWFTSVVDLGSGIGLRVSNGTAALPGVRFLADGDNGLNRVGPDNWGLSAGGVNVVLLNGNVNGVVGTALAQAVNTSGTPGLLTATGAAHTGMALAAMIDVSLALTRTIRFLDGAVPGIGYRGLSITPPSIGGTTAVQATVNDPTTLYVSGPPTADSNVSLVNPKALWVDSGETRLDGPVRTGAEFYSNITHVGDADYTVTTGDYAVAFSTTLTASRVCNLPAISSNRNRVVIIKHDLTAGAFTVTITPNGAETIDGAATRVLAGRGSAMLIGPETGTNWIVAAAV